MQEPTIMEPVQELAVLWPCPSVLSDNHLPLAQSSRVIMLNILVNQ